MYIKPLSTILHSHTNSPHSFADDIQSQMSAPPVDVSKYIISVHTSIIMVIMVIHKRNSSRVHIALSLKK